MCKFGDIIVVNDYIGADGERLRRHSFVVINDTPGEIQGLNYSLVANVMSSFKNEKHRERKLSYEENIEVTSEDIESQYKNNRNGYIKADQLFYFDKEKLVYYVLARIDSDLLDELVQLVIRLSCEGKITEVLENIKEPIEN